MAYVDDILASHKQKVPAFTKGLTRKKWLGANNGWRQALRDMGKKAVEIQRIDDIAKARAEWLRFTRRDRNMIGQHIATIPLLKSSHDQAQSDEAAFWGFMSDLATLAKV